MSNIKPRMVILFPYKAQDDLPIPDIKPEMVVYTQYEAQDARPMPNIKPRITFLCPMIRPRMVLITDAIPMVSLCN